jgi:transcription elongation GreA/GreB family factor
MEMREEFDKLAATGKISRHQVEPLVQLTKSGYCLHRSWGFGKITTVDTVFARFTIDFQTKSGHTMDLSFAAESLKPIDPSHILARKAADLEGLRQMAAVHHLDLIKLVLQSYAGKATQEQIQQVLVPDVIRDDWKKWWEAAKREMRKDGHFLIPAKKTEPVLYQAKEVSLDERLVADFRAAKGLKAKVIAVTEALKSFPDVVNKQALATEFVTNLNADIVTHQRTQPAVALEGIFVREDLRKAAEVPVQEGELASKEIWAQNANRLAEILEETPAVKHRHILQSFIDANADTWIAGILSILNSLPAKICTECANILIHHGKLADLKDAVARLVSQHAASSEMLLWLARERSDSYADILGPEVFRAMLTAMERDQFNEKRSNRLRDYILSDESLLVELIGSADFDVIKDLTRSLQLSPVFDDMDKRSLLGRIVKSYPAIQSLITGEQAKQEASLVVSWESLERRRQEYTELVQKKIPANSKEIAIARSYGDLRENHEYKAAKEMQKLLMRRKAELEQNLLRARGTDFANARLDAASIGTIVTVREMATENDQQFTILGAWDSEPDKGFISYLSPLAQALIGRKVDEEFECDVEGVHKKYHLKSIQPFKTDGAGAPPAQPAAAAPEDPVAAPAALEPHVEQAPQQ